MHTSLAVADYLLAKAKEKSTTLTPMQVIKLVYLCHGWMLGLYGRPLITEDVEAWRYGPVIHVLHAAVRKYRSRPVVGPLSSTPGVFGKDELSVMGQVFDIYGGFPGVTLSSLTHAEGSPWRKTWDGDGRTISNDLIANHFYHLSKR